MLYDGGIVVVEVVLCEIYLWFYLLLLKALV